LAKLPSDGTAPYALMVFAGMCPGVLLPLRWPDASNSLIAMPISSASLFPPVDRADPAVMVAFRIFSSALRSLSVYGLVPVHAGLAATAVCRPSRRSPSWAGRGVGAWIRRSMLNISTFVRHSVHCAARLYVSLVGFSSAISPDQWSLGLLRSNPMVGVIGTGFGGACSAVRASSIARLWLSSPCKQFFPVVGLPQFQETLEKSFADLI